MDEKLLSESGLSGTNEYWNRKKNRPETRWPGASGRSLERGFAKGDLDVVEVEFDLAIAKIIFQVKGG